VRHLHRRAGLGATWVQLERHLREAVKGGLIAPPPNLANLDDGGDPRSTTDFRDMTL